MAALCFLFVCVLLAAMVARKLRDNVLAPSARRVASHSCVALRLQLSKRSLRGLDLPVKIDAARRPAKRAPEQEHILVAVGPVRIGLNAMKLRIGLAHVIFDAGKLILPGIWRAGSSAAPQAPGNGDSQNRMKAHAGRHRRAGHRQGVAETGRRGTAHRRRPIEPPPPPHPQPWARPSFAPAVITARTQRMVKPRRKVFMSPVADRRSPCQTVRLLKHEPPG